MLECRPHKFVLLGSDVDIAWKVEQSGEALKIHVTEAVINKLNGNTYTSPSAVDLVDQLFDYTPRSGLNRSKSGLPDGIRTYWLNGRHTNPYVDVAVVQDSIARAKMN